MKSPRKHLVLAAAIVALAINAVAAPVSFWFSGTVDYCYNPSNAMPSGIAVGTPFSGRITYDAAWISYSNWNTYASGDTSTYYFTNTPGFSVLVQIGDHTITNTPNLDGYQCGYIGIYDQFDNSDSFSLDTEHSDIIVDGNSTRVGNHVPIISLYLRDDAKTAYNTVSLPTSAPALSQFPSQQVFGWMTRLDDGIGTTFFSISGNITTIATNELVALNLRRSGVNTVQLGWPTAVSGYTLQSSTNLAPGSWQSVTNPIVNTAMEYTVTVSPVGPEQFYRLKK